MGIHLQIKGVSLFGSESKFYNRLIKEKVPSACGESVQFTESRKPDDTVLCYLTIEYLLSVSNDLTNL